jgi:hypothetical protein
MPISTDSLRLKNQTNDVVLFLLETMLEGTHKEALEVVVKTMLLSCHNPNQQDACW